MESTNTYPGIGGTLAAKHGYTCKSCGSQIISSIPTERCEPCHASTATKERTMLDTTYNGVLLPTDMQDASTDEKHAYARGVKAVNRAFCEAYFELTDRAEELKVDLPS